METTLPLPFLPGVDLGKGLKGSTGLNRTQLSYLGCVFFTVDNELVDRLLQFLQMRTHAGMDIYVDVKAVESREDIITILDAGARKVFVHPKHLEALKVHGERVVPVVEAVDSLSTQKYDNGILYLADEDETKTRAGLKGLVDSKTSPIFITTSAKNIESYVKLAQEFGAIPIIPAATSLTVGEGSTEEVSVPAFIGGSWISDRADKLIPTLVTDERGSALGLVYSSQESLAESLKTGTGVDQSRKRGLGYKGATSGDTEELGRISLDCDQDCLKFVVRQQGRGQ